AAMEGADLRHAPRRVRGRSRPQPARRRPELYVEHAAELVRPELPAGNRRVLRRTAVPWNLIRIGIRRPARIGAGPRLNGWGGEFSKWWGDHGRSCWGEGTGIGRLPLRPLPSRSEERRVGTEGRV